MAMFCTSLHLKSTRPSPPTPSRSTVLATSRSSPSSCPASSTSLAPTLSPRFASSPSPTRRSSRASSGRAALPRRTMTTSPTLSRTSRPARRTRAATTSPPRSRTSTKRTTRCARPLRGRWRAVAAQTRAAVIVVYAEGGLRKSIIASVLPPISLVLCISAKTWPPPSGPCCSCSLFSPTCSLLITHAVSCTRPNTRYELSMLQLYFVKNPHDDTVCDLDLGNTAVCRQVGIRMY